MSAADDGPAPTDREVRAARIKIFRRRASFVVLVACCMLPFAAVWYEPVRLAVERLVPTTDECKALRAELASAPTSARAYHVFVVDGHAIAVGRKDTAVAGDVWRGDVHALSVCRGLHDE